MDGKHGAAVAGERSELATGVRFLTVHCIGLIIVMAFQNTEAKSPAERF